MKPHIEEAWRSLRLADRDIKAFHILRQESEAPVSIIGFHAQQAVEKSLKAVLFSRRLEFERTHDLVKLARLLGRHGAKLPVPDDQLRQLNPFAVTLRYDDLEVHSISQEDTGNLISAVRRWSEEQVEAASQREEPHAPDHH